MKATKNQTNAVRAYLATLGIEIGHVQALEVIARGAGQRSRHVQAPAAAGGNVASGADQAPARDAFAQAQEVWAQYRAEGGTLNQATAKSQLMALFPELFDSPEAAVEFLESEDDESVDRYCELVSLANAIRQAYEEAGRTPAAQAEALKDLVTQCNILFREYRAAYVFLGGTGISSQGTSLLSDAIRAAYHDSGCQRSDLEEAVHRLVTECADSFEGEEAAVAFLHEEAETPAATDEVSKAQEIKAEYDSSRCHADDVDHAVRRLMAECPGLFSDDRRAWSFINEEQHEELEGEDFLVQVESELFGNEVFTYYTEEERRAGVIRLMAKAVELNDGVNRRYYFTNIDSDIEKNSPEYDQALEERDIEGEIVDSVVKYQGNRIGSIAELTEGGLTLYSWIDDNP